MKLHSITRLLAIAILTVGMSCNKDNSSVNDGKGEIEFSMKSVNSLLKSTMVNNITNVSKAIISIEKLDGSQTDFTYKEISIYKMNEEYFTQKIALTTGFYKLTEFFLLDENGNTVYACPKEGSSQAQNVNQPLSISFDIEKDKSVSVTVEVISTEDLTPADFGLIWFPIAEVETFSFMISVSEKGTNTLLPAKILVTADSYSFSQNLEEIVTNIVKIKSGYDEYVLTISYSGYKTVNQSYTKEGLVQFSETPLVVEMEKDLTDNGPILKMPFNGSIVDITDHIASNQIYPYQIEFVADRKGNEASAILVNPSNRSHITILSDIFSNRDYTYSVWYKAIELPYSGVLHSIINAGGYAGSQTLGISYEYCGFSGICGGSWISSSESYHTETGTLFEPGKWYQLTYTREDAALRVYINGSLRAELNDTPRAPYYSDEMLKIGCRWNDEQFANGVIDDVIVYDRALSAEEVANLYSSGE